MDQLKDILTHYLRLIAREAGVSWDWENEGEIIDAFDQFETQVTQMVADEVKRQLDERLPAAGQNGPQDA